MNRIVSVWKPSLQDAHLFIHGHGLEEFFVQFVRVHPPAGFWIVFKMPQNVWKAVKATGPGKLSVIE